MRHITMWSTELHYEAGFGWLRCTFLVEMETGKVKFIKSTTCGRIPPPLPPPPDGFSSWMLLKDRLPCVFYELNILMAKMIAQNQQMSLTRSCDQ